MTGSKKKSKAGRPSLGELARSRVVTVKVTEAEYQAWETAAGDQTLSEWIRQRCNGL